MDVACPDQSAAVRHLTSDAVGDSNTAFEGTFRTCDTDGALLDRSPAPDYPPATGYGHP
jgi:hypothetical protein